MKKNEWQRRIFITTMSKESEIQTEKNVNVKRKKERECFILSKH
jgi:hypothetical protein